MKAKTPQQKRKLEQELDKMSPFEIKNTLIDMAEDEARVSSQTFLNAGRGNPNWLLSWPRRAFFLLGQFAMDECERISYDTAIGIAASPVKKGCGERLHQFLTAHKDDVGARVLVEFFSYMVNTYSVDEDDFAWELVDGITGDHYPTP
ncbi:MAG: aspartate 4-decarboxylase, partial [Desulfovibrio sp.]|nr:aspartate 4-decarboxylase [Desulfovibrio sp.]